MKFRVDSAVLADVVAWAARSIPNRPGTVPQLACLLVRASSDGLSVSGFDYETSAHVTVTADVTDDGEVLVSGRLLADICRALPHGVVDVATDGAKVAITCGSSRFSLQTVPAEDYPTLPQMPPTVGSVDSEAFAAAVVQAVSAAGRDDMLPVLTGVKLEISGDRVRMLACDRFRLSQRELGWTPTAAAITSSALVPARVLADTARWLPPGATVQIALGETAGSPGLMGFVVTGPGGQRQVTTRLIDGAFPNVSQLFPTTSTRTAVVRLADLVESVKRVSLVAGRNTSIRLTFEADQITLEAGNGEEAQGTEAIGATLSGDPLTIGFNPSYLLDGLSVFTTPYIRVALTEPGKPALVTGLEDPDGDPATDFQYLVMPLRMQA